LFNFCLSFRPLADDGEEQGRSPKRSRTKRILRSVDLLRIRWLLSLTRRCGVAPPHSDDEDEAGAKKSDEDDDDAA
jgi:hypothetical protein